MCLGIPGEIVTVRDHKGMRMADVRFAGITREVCLDCTPEAKVGDYVLVHVGFAISRIDRALAEDAYRALDAMGVTSELTADREASAAAARSPAGRRDGDGEGEGDDADEAAREGKDTSSAAEGARR